MLMSVFLICDEAMGKVYFEEALFAAVVSRSLPQPNPTPLGSEAVGLGILHPKNPRQN